jgi:hypothetical protein
MDYMNLTCSKYKEDLWNVYIQYFLHREKSIEGNCYIISNLYLQY